MSSLLQESASPIAADLEEPVFNQDDLVGL